MSEDNQIKCCDYCKENMQPIYIVTGVPMTCLELDEEDQDNKDGYTEIDVDGEVRFGLEVCRECRSLIGYWVESSTLINNAGNELKEHLEFIQDSVNDALMEIELIGGSEDNARKKLHKLLEVNGKWTR